MKTEPHQFTYQQRCLVQAVRHIAHGLGCAALGDFKGAAAHGKAITAWTALAAFTQSMVLTGTPQWLLDATWVEPIWDESADDESTEAN